MKREDLYDGITDIREDVLQKADAHKFNRPKKSRRPWWMGCLAACLALAIVAIALLWPEGTPLTANAYAISLPQYPEMVQYPELLDYMDAITHDVDDSYYEALNAWSEGRHKQLAQPEGYAGGLEDFYTKSVPLVLSGAGGENKLYSPLNVYMALAMLAESTDGNSRQQVLQLLGCNSIEDLRVKAKALWNANYCDDGMVTSILGSSVWLNQGIPCNRSTLDTLADTYYAASFQGEMGSTEFNHALQQWLNEQTGGMLEDQISGIEMTANTVLALATTINFNARWDSEFSESKTTPQTFHAPTGDLVCDFMHKSGSREYYCGEQFSAISQELSGSGAMWFLLPDEGVTVDGLLQDPQTMEFLLANGKWENSKYLTVNFALPKFDVTTQTDLSGNLQALGISDVFDPTRSNFSPLVTEDTGGMFLSLVSHGVRVVVDEEGCTAAAFTVMPAAGAALPPEEEVDFVLDRPFLVAITGASGQLLFVGVINQPV